MKIRQEQAGDQAAIRAVHTAAFETTTEARLVEDLRAQASPLVSWVAEAEGRVVGHILFSPMRLPGHPALVLMGLAPMAVLPAWQRQGVGAALVQAGLEACRQRGVDAVLVLGHPDYYPKFGFVAAARYALRSEYDVPDEVFLLQELRPGALRGVAGTVYYHPAFENL
ncbi:putative acetyltransferase [Catalinimonas alkaloidigena]|uniref:Putative acetyltransferase n=1 Tax=Catalinimonas alkaloidigena TaxID=1075417 RepID=A0A1G9GSV5_9BACT|nr:N-acetyltransferase [Catalinimonas alkaloidigena]SDL03766.1 putative acetyltransferase [Catalinimonas alkaloidigena]